MCGGVQFSFGAKSNNTQPVRSSDSLLCQQWAHHFHKTGGDMSKGKKEEKKERGKQCSTFRLVQLVRPWITVVPRWSQISQDAQRRFTYALQPSQVICTWFVSNGQHDKEGRRRTFKKQVNLNNESNESTSYFNYLFSREFLTLPSCTLELKTHPENPACRRPSHLTKAPLCNI